MKSSSVTSRPVGLEVHEEAVVAAVGHKETQICLDVEVLLQELDEYHKEVSSGDVPHPPQREIPLPTHE